MMDFVVSSNVSHIINNNLCMGTKDKSRNLIGYGIFVFRQTNV